MIFSDDFAGRRQPPRPVGVLLAARHARRELRDRHAVGAAVPAVRAHAGASACGLRPAPRSRARASRMRVQTLTESRAEPDTREQRDANAARSNAEPAATHGVSTPPRVPPRLCGLCGLKARDLGSGLAPAVVERRALALRDDVRLERAHVAGRRRPSGCAAHRVLDAPVDHVAQQRDAAELRPGTSGRSRGACWPRPGGTCRTRRRSCCRARRRCGRRVEPCDDQLRASRASTSATSCVGDLAVGLRPGRGRPARVLSAGVDDRVLARAPRPPSRRPGSSRCHCAISASAIFCAVLARLRRVGGDAGRGLVVAELHLDGRSPASASAAGRRRTARRAGRRRGRARRRRRSRRVMCASSSSSEARPGWAWPARSFLPPDAQVGAR